MNGMEGIQIFLINAKIIQVKLLDYLAKVKKKKKKIKFIKTQHIHPFDTDLLQLECYRIFPFNSVKMTCVKHIKMCIVYHIRLQMFKNINDG